jgi:hypothetical protein
LYLLMSTLRWLYRYTSFYNIHTVYSCIHKHYVQTPLYVYKRACCTSPIHMRSSSTGTASVRRAVSAAVMRTWGVAQLDVRFVVTLVSLAYTTCK